jgi:hypothetical protein
VSSIALLGSNVRAISGHWKVQLSFRPSSLTMELPLPASGGLGATTIEFVTVRANDAYLHVQFTSDARHNNGCRIDPVVYGPDGRRLTMLNMSADLPGESQGRRFMQTVEWQLADRPGAYRIVLTDNRQTRERTIVASTGRSGSDSWRGDRLAEKRRLRRRHGATAPTAAWIRRRARAGGWPGIRSRSCGSRLPIRSFPSGLTVPTEAMRLRS